jgi:hypothetical protein
VLLLLVLQLLVLLLLVLLLLALLLLVLLLLALLLLCVLPPCPLCCKHKGLRRHVRIWGLCRTWHSAAIQRLYLQVEGCSSRHLRHKALRFCSCCCPCCRWDIPLLLQLLLGRPRWLLLLMELRSGSRSSSFRLMGPRLRRWR